MLLRSYLQILRWANQPGFGPIAAAVAGGLLAAAPYLAAISTVVNVATTIDAAVEGRPNYSQSNVNFHAHTA